MALKKTHDGTPRQGDARSHARDTDGLLTQLESADPGERRWAARDLFDCTDVSAALVARLSRESDASVREMLFSALTHRGDPIAVRGLVSCLRSEDVAMRNAAIASLTQLPEAVGPIMTELLHDADPDVRIFAVNVLESLRHPDVESWLIAVIEDDPHLNVCATAADLLVEVGTLAARPALEGLRTRFADESYIQFVTTIALNRMIDA